MSTTHFNLPFSCFISVVEASVILRLSGERSGVVGTSYSLTCSITVPHGVSQFSPNVQWKRPNMPYTRALIISAITNRGFTAILSISSLQTSHAGDYLCRAGYFLGNNINSELSQGTFILDVISKSTVTLVLQVLVCNWFRPNRYKQ